ncbi:MAG: hypothetical protein KC964_29440, partial [Candidatus Omnitrophica bacterium]|nr:hypothetical protein [Candidatus Omnitrophota bacterium]
ALRDCNNNGIMDGCEIAADPSLDLDGDGVPDECGIMIGSVVSPPAGADHPVNGEWVVPPVIDPVSSAFIHPYDGRVIASDRGSFDILWASGGETVLETYIVGTQSSVCMYRTDTGAGGGGPTVDLTPVVEGFG